MTKRIFSQMLVFCFICLLTCSSYALTIDPRYSNTIAQVRSFIASGMASQEVMGLSIALVDSNEIVWAEGFGYADDEADILVTDETVFHIGSVSKAITATLALQVIDDGMMALDDAITNFLPTFSMRPRFTNSPPVTIRSLLDYQCGLPGDILNNGFTTKPESGFSDWLFNYITNTYPSYPVNFVNSYCNSAFVLMEDVIEVCSGLSFSDFARSNLFSVLGMEATSYLFDSPIISNRLAHPYIQGYRYPDEYVNLYGTGSMYSSADDMAQLIKMYLAQGMSPNGRILETNSIIEMMTQQPSNQTVPLDVNSFFKAGLGWDTVIDPQLGYGDIPAASKNGSTFVNCGFLEVLPTKQLGVITMQNSPGGFNMDVARKALQWAIYEKTGVQWPTNAYVPPFSPVTNWAQPDLDALEGLYVNGGGLDRIEARPGGLTWTRDLDTEAPYSLELVPRANGLFSTTNSQDIQIAFTNISERAIIIGHGAAEFSDYVSLYAERLIPPAIPTVWSNRLSRKYIMSDLNAIAYEWLISIDPQFTFFTKEDVLLMNTFIGHEVLGPVNDNLAFLQGLRYRAEGCIQMGERNGFETVQFNGYTWIDQASMLGFEVGTTSNGITHAEQITWYAIPAISGQVYAVQLNTTNQIVAHVLDQDRMRAGECTVDDIITFQARGTGSFYVAVACSETSAPFELRIYNSWLHVINDFDGDYKTDLALYEPVVGMWRIMQSSDNTIHTQQWGWAESLAVSGDFDGDSKSDITVYAPSSGLWYEQLSLDHQLRSRQWGWDNTIQAPADYDGDGITDECVFYPETGIWYIRESASGQLRRVEWGWDAAQPVHGDFDGDQLFDVAIYIPSTGDWCIQLSSGGCFSLNWGWGDAHPVPADYDGDGIYDVAVYRPREGLWYIRQSHNGSTRMINWGWTDALPVPGDYDGDGIADLCVYYPEQGLWFILYSLSGEAKQIHFGSSNEFPLQNDAPVESRGPRL